MLDHFHPFRKWPAWPIKISLPTKRLLRITLLYLVLVSTLLYKSSHLASKSMSLTSRTSHKHVPSSQSSPVFDSQQLEKCGLETGSTRSILAHTHF